ncbi:GFA domain-containing protein [Mycena venus]|uniref:GFA domain-containing protein n=1 Tax=Mycena venus TaxID=2733690 RepID=A0A8H6XA88_9AGAR|nr:GFA domain-containing protein [Mycena venus]
MTPPAEAKTPTLPPVAWPEDAEIKVYTGGCHCKKIRYEFEHPDIYTMPVVDCNCSICEAKGYLMVYVREEKFKFTAGSEDDLTKYEFASRTASHRFCSTCGSSIGPIGKGILEGVVVVNVRTVDGIDLPRLQLQKNDGRSY